MSFNELSIKELRRLAEEVYPVELSAEENADRKKAAAALEQVGASWPDYLAKHSTPEVQAKYAAEYNALIDPDNKPGGTGVVTSAKVTGKAGLEPVLVSTEPVEEVRIITKEPTKVTEVYLVKMTRANPLFQIGKYKFSKDHPYALVDGSDLRTVLSEEGFRQAYPDEVDDYYDSQ